MRHICSTDLFEIPICPAAWEFNSVILMDVTFGNGARKWRRFRWEAGGTALAAPPEQVRESPGP